MPEDRTGSVHLLWTALACEGGLALLAWGLGLLLSRPPLTQIHFTLEAIYWGLAGTAPLLLLLVVTTRWPIGPIKEIQQAVDELVVPVFREASCMQMAIIALAAGVGEEMLFRGVVQEAISQRFKSPLLALVAASIGFGLLHPINTAYAVLAALIGAYLGGLWMLTDNLLPPIITHAAYDFFALLYLVRRKTGDVDQP